MRSIIRSGANFEGKDSGFLPVLGTRQKRAVFHLLVVICCFGAVPYPCPISQKRCEATELASKFLRGLLALAGLACWRRLLRARLA